MDIKTIKAIDVHTHMNTGGRFDAADSDTSTIAPDWILKTSHNAGIDTILCSAYSAVISSEEVAEQNRLMQRLTETYDELYQWVVIEPRQESTFRQAEEMLNCGKCVGIKLHPVCHHYSFEEYGDKLFSFASEYNAIVQIHPEKEADYILPYADKYRDVTFLVAHMASYNAKCYADAIRLAKNGNVYTDTSGMASISNRGVENIVGQAGSERILFGTDGYAAGFQRGRIEYALISDEDKKNILRDNAERLFGKFLK